MRKTNKKSLGSKWNRKGVILVTILFIVAIALIFVTTALTISLAARSRIYSNAIDDQSRLTVYSLAESFWQAIYNQQVTDDQLKSLADGNSVINFTSDAVPGLGKGGSEATASFWNINNKKIGIEFKCDIDGTAEYYTMVLYKNETPKITGSAFNFQVEITGGEASINSVNFGMDVSSLNGNTYTGQKAYNATDNIIFLHNPKFSGQDNFGFYSTVVTDGIVAFQDSIFARDVVFIGANAGLAWSSNQISSDTVNNQYGDWYFYGVTAPFYRHTNEVINVTSWWPYEYEVVSPASDTAISGTDVFTLRGVGSIYFDKNKSNGNSGFENFTMTFQSQNLQDIKGALVYEDGITINGTTGVTETSFSSGTDITPDSYTQYLTYDSSRVDTVPELISNYHLDVAEASATTGTFADFAGDDYSETITSGFYKITDSSLNGTINCDLSGGSIYMFLANGLDIYGNSYILVSGSGSDMYGQAAALYLILPSGKVLTLKSDNCGVIDLNVFTNTDSSDSYFNAKNLDQTKCPSIYLLSLGAGGQDYQLKWESNQNQCLTAYVGFYPSTEQGTDAAGVYIYNSVPSKVYYGRMGCSNIDTSNTGGNFNIPYCPIPTSKVTDDSRPFRYGTSYSVVGSESGYYTYYGTDA